MVDYTRSTGTAGTLVIRDHGYNVEFLLRSADGGTFTGTPGFRWWGTVNGSGVEGRVANYSNSEWRSVGTWGVGYNQDVTFRIDASGTQGFGGPTSFSQYINRATVPGAPTNLRVTYQGHTRMGISYDRGPDNGAGIVQDEATWYYPGGRVVWTDPNCAGYTDPQDGAVGPKLDLYREYHIYIRSRNSVGWGPSAAIPVRTLASGFIKYEGVYRPYVRYIKINGVYYQAIPFVKDGGVYKASRN